MEISESVDGLASGLRKGPHRPTGHLSIIANSSTCPQEVCQAGGGGRGGGWHFTNWVRLGLAIPPAPRGGSPCHCAPRHLKLTAVRTMYRQIRMVLRPSMDTPASMAWISSREWPSCLGCTYVLQPRWGSGGRPRGISLVLITTDKLGRKALQKSLRSCGPQPEFKCTVRVTMWLGPAGLAWQTRPPVRLAASDNPCATWLALAPSPQGRCPSVYTILNV
jgi:hypothetical protein